MVIRNKINCIAIHYISVTNKFTLPGIVIEEEHLHDTNGISIPYRKTTSITLTTAAEAASMANQQHQGQGMFIFQY